MIFVMFANKSGGAASKVILGLLVALTLLLCTTERALAQAGALAAPTASTWVVPTDDAIRALLNERMATNGVGIVVGIVGPEGRRLVVHGRSGAPDQRPLDGDTIFQVGSVTKLFTTLLLADMALKGEVRLDDPASKYLPRGATMPQSSPPITLADLATHMSGLPAMPTNFDLSASDPVEAYSPADLDVFLASYFPRRLPGEGYEYSNLGVALLGRLLAYRAGLQYEQLLRERILLPLGMTSSSISLTPEQSRRLAPGHDRYLHPVHTSEMRTLQGSGSLRSSANDLLTFLEACLGHRKNPLTEALTYQRDAVRRPFSGGVQMLGWSERTSQGTVVVGHDGGKEGYRSAVLFNPATRVGVVILANARTDDTPIALAAHLLTGRRLGPAPSAPIQTLVEVAPALLNAYVGRYTLPNGSVIRIARRGDHILMDLVGSGITELFPAALHEFHSNTSDEMIRFNVQPDGRTNGVDYVVGSRSLAATRTD